MLLTIEKVLILKSVNIFSSVEETQLADMATVVDTVEYEAGETIIRQGELGNSMYIVASGRVCFTKDGISLSEMGERTVFGELAALDPEPRAVDVTALEDCTLLRLDGESLYELMSGNIDVTRGIVQVLCEYTRSNLALANTLR